MGRGRQSWQAILLGLQNAGFFAASTRVISTSASPTTRPPRRCTNSSPKSLRCDGQSDVEIPLTRALLAALAVLLLGSPAVPLEPIPDKLVVLTFDDSAKSHYTVARPILMTYKF